MNTIIKDRTGSVISQFSIVKVVGEYCTFSGFQGLVIEPNSTIEGPEYTVAVYFFGEVERYHFNYRQIDEYTAEIWDTKFANENKEGDGKFLLADDIWKKSPRIIFFKPEELLVQDGWDITNLTNRFFRGRWHSLKNLGSTLPQKPEAYMCFIKGCKNPATETAVCNVWGTVVPLFVCEECMKKYNGLCGDSLPDMKNPFISRDGKVIQIQAE